jgi:hypothetical protein
MPVIGEKPRQVLATATTSTTATEGAHLPVNATAANRTVTLPTGTAHGSRISVEKTDATANTVTVSGSLRGAAGTVVLTTQFETVDLVADSTGSWHPIGGRLNSGGGAGGGAVTVVDNGDGTFTVSGSGVTANGDGTYTISS